MRNGGDIRNFVAHLSDSVQHSYRHHHDTTHVYRPPINPTDPVAAAPDDLVCASEAMSGTRFRAPMQDPATALDA